MKKTKLKKKLLQRKRRRGLGPRRNPPLKPLSKAQTDKLMADTIIQWMFGRIGLAFAEVIPGMREKVLETVEQEYKRLGELREKD